jgi:hypothetical protein
MEEEPFCNYVPIHTQRKAACSGEIK